MNNTDFVMDTNAVIYYMNADNCMKEYHGCAFYISDVTEIELLSCPDIDIHEEIKAKAFLRTCEMISIDRDIVEQAIMIRKKYETKLADAIIAATAVVYDLPIITADKGFKKIKEIDLRLIKPKDLAKS